MNSYFDFAENDYRFFRLSYDMGNKGTALAALGQNICERYLKHIISEYANPDTQDDMDEKEAILRTHNLHKLIYYISCNMGIEIPRDVVINMELINTFYFTTTYPGDESFIPTEEDIDSANEAVESTRNLVVEICRSMEDKKLR